jgi:hypothetical protein
MLLRTVAVDSFERLLLKGARHRISFNNVRDVGQYCERPQQDPKG